MFSLSRYLSLKFLFGRGGLTVWRTFLNLSKMMYLLAFSGNWHVCVFIILFLFWYCGSPAWGVLKTYPVRKRLLAGKWKATGIFVSPFYELTGIFVSPIMKWRVSLWARLWSDRYLCEPDYEAMEICVSPILKGAGICVRPINKWAGICVEPDNKKSERVSVCARFSTEWVSLWAGLWIQMTGILVCSPILLVICVLICVSLRLTSCGELAIDATYI